jgi:hypothetical protein
MDTRKPPAKPNSTGDRDAVGEGIGECEAIIGSKVIA